MKLQWSIARWQSWLVAIMLLGLGPLTASAHLVTTGMGPVYDGIGHLLLTFEDLVPALAIALFAGLRGASTGRHAVWMLPSAWFAGGVAGAVIQGLPSLPVPAISFIVLGTLIAADFNLPARAFQVLVVSVGFVHGVLNGIALRDGVFLLGLMGIMATLFVLVALVAAFVVSLQKPWTRIVVRVAGSWIAAVGLLMIGWMARGQG